MMNYDFLQIQNKSYSGNLSDVQEILKKYKKSEKKFLQQNNYMPLRMATIGGNLNVIKEFLKYIPLSALKTHDNYIVRYASLYGHIHIVRFVFNSFPFSDHKEIILSSCCQALVYAAINDQIDIIQYLFDRYSTDRRDIASLLMQYKDIMYQACINRRYALLEYLFNYFTNEEQKRIICGRNNYIFLEACRCGNKQALILFFSIFSDDEIVKIIRKDEDFALRIACEHGYLEVVEYLFENGYSTIEEKQSVIKSKQNYLIVLASDNYNYTLVSYLADIMLK